MKQHNLKIIALLVLLATTLTYLNHFDNSFQFDDYSVIVNNLNIRSLKNIPLFFLDATTYSAHVPNQAYRPFVSTTLAFDYWVAGGYYPFYFRLPMFMAFLIQGVLMYFIYCHLLSKSFSKDKVKIIAFLPVAIYLLHPVNAETVNYIISRTDLYSTLFIVCSFFFFTKGGIYRKYFIYLIPFIIGLFTKRTTIMLLPILMAYIVLYESNYSLIKFYKIFTNKYHRSHLKHLLVVTIISIGAYSFIDYMTGSVFDYGISRIQYLITQPFVILRYFYLFFLPTGLSADTDWQLLVSIWDPRFIVGSIFIISTLLFALYLSKTRTGKPAAFGIIWFYIALIPTSTVIPLTEVTNDHRMYFPYIGLCLSVVYIAYQIFIMLSNSSIKRQTLNYATMMLIVLILTGLSVGTYCRNKVWDNPETLWRDVSIKSPNNGRGLMNYGLALMNNGHVEEALKMYNRSEKLLPNYSYLHINKGIAFSKLGQNEEAEENFLKAIELEETWPQGYFYYAQFLYEQGKYYSSLHFANESLKKLPSYINSLHLKMRLYSIIGDVKNLTAAAENTLQYHPQDALSKSFLSKRESVKPKDIESDSLILTPDQLLSLSLDAYNNGQFEQCISLCKKALSINENFPEAYNNICSAYIQLNSYELASKACEKAIELNPNFELAANNLRYIRSLPK